MSGIYIDYRDNDLFGNDAAEQEKDNVFKTYAIQRPEVHDFLDVEQSIQIARAYKGEGKSAILRIVKEQLQKDKPDSLVISATGVTLSPAIDSDDSDLWTREWKKRILSLIASEVGSRIGFAYTDDATSLVEESELNGFKSRSLLSSIVDRLSSSAIPMQRKREGVVNHEALLARWMENGESVWLIIDDIDQNFKNTERNKLKVASYFTAIRQIVSSIPEVRVRTSVRPNIWKIIKREYEALSHVEQYMRDITWSHEDIVILLAKRVQGYLERASTWSEAQEYLSDDLGVRNSQLIRLIFEEQMPWGQNDRRRPASIVLATLSRHRPRWLVELCKEASKSAEKRNADKIYFDDIVNELEEFGKRRVDDTIAEYQSQCPQIEEIISAFSKQNERYPTADLLKLIEDRVLQPLNPKIFGIVGKPSHKEVAHFLFQIGFITARQDNADRSYNHISFDMNPSLLKSRTNIDDGVSWEIHPVFRQALQLKNVDTKQAIKAKAKKSRR